MKRVIQILCGVALVGLLIVGGCTGLFFYVKSQEEGQMAALLNEKSVLQKHFGVIEDVDINLLAKDKRSPNGELMFLSVEGTKSSGTLIYGEIMDGNQTVTVMELKLADGRVIDLNGKLEILGWGTEDTTESPKEGTKDSSGVEK